MSNWDASKHLWLNSFGSQTAVMEISCSVDHTWQKKKSVLSYSGVLDSFLCPLEKVKFQFVLSRTSLTLKWSTCTLAPTSLAAKYIVKEILGSTHSLWLIWGNIYSHSMELPHTPKSHKNCTISSPRSIFQSERWSLWEGASKSQHLGPLGRGGCMTLWFRRS